MATQMTLDQIEAEERKLKDARAELQKKRDAIYGSRILGCSACGKWQRARETEVVIDQEFRCPGQTGGYFIDAGTFYKCKHCGDLSGRYGDLEIQEIPERVFKAVERKELSR